MQDDAAKVAAGFVLRRWEVTVDGYSPQTFLASSRGKAIARAWRDYSSVFDIAFGEFIKRAKCRLDRHQFPNSRFGDPITVGGKPAFFVCNDRQYVTFAYPGGEFTLVSHPYDVLPEEYRPDTYRQRTLLKGQPS